MESDTKERSAAARTCKLHVGVVDRLHALGIGSARELYTLRALYDYALLAWRQERKLFTITPGCFIGWHMRRTTL
eukprot:1407795-Pyramimonas_sp.AAC.1